ncbi:MBL fold metallo-hydrolase [Bdellovibrio sp. HCB2-146]|uniref:MBL fold metallo-hydrolase n=1 Tax=Bdellovibrio sp. HCB2-146 TaxID=3394362 RepID=UPI0039BC4425
MKRLEFITLGVGMSLLFGCQSYRYYDPQKPHHGQEGFLNNYDNSPKQSFWKWQWERWTTEKPKEAPFTPEVLKTDTTFLKNNKTEPTLTWIGHSSFLLQLEGMNILTDPVFSARTSPVSFAGPKRQVALPFQLEELPAIDVVVISHNHYDHLDLATLKKLSQRPDNKTIFLVPLGNQKLLQSEGIQKVQEYDWWDQVKAGPLNFILTPTQHWSARGLFDNNETLWGAWYIQGTTQKVFFAGDTGYSKDFQDVASKLGPVDLALIPIGAYEPRWFMKKHHVNPSEAVQIHKDLQAKKSVAIHWGTFRLSDEAMISPAEDLKKSLSEQRLSENDFILMKHGERISL